jgi:hypothetical protein
MEQLIEKFDNFVDSLLVGVSTIEEDGSTLTKRGSIIEKIEEGVNPDSLMKYWSSATDDYEMRFDESEVVDLPGDIEFICDRVSDSRFYEHVDVHSVHCKVLMYKFSDTSSYLPGVTVKIGLAENHTYLSIDDSVKSSVIAKFPDSGRKESFYSYNSVDDLPLEREFVHSLFMKVDELCEIEKKALDVSPKYIKSFVSENKTNLSEKFDYSRDIIHNN